jgi:hypothetical protein
MTYSDAFNLRTNNVTFNDVADAIDGAVTLEWGGTTTGTSTIYTASPDPAWGSLTEPRRVVIVPHTTNAGATTLNVSGTGHIVVKQHGSACVGGELIQNRPTDLVYDGTDFHIISNVDMPWTDWTPSFATVSGMSYTVSSIFEAKYRRHGKSVEGYLFLTGATSGTTTNRLRMNLPVTGASGTSFWAGIYLEYAGGPLGAFALPISTTQIDIRLYDAANITCPATVIVGGGFKYRVA